jgi:hypothetical protein
MAAATPDDALRVAESRLARKAAHLVEIEAGRCPCDVARFIEDLGLSVLDDIRTQFCGMHMELNARIVAKRRGDGDDYERRREIDQAEVLVSQHVRGRWFVDVMLERFLGYLHLRPPVMVPLPKLPTGGSGDIAGFMLGQVLAGTLTRTNNIEVFYSSVPGISRGAANQTTDAAAASPANTPDTESGHSTKFPNKNRVMRQQHRACINAYIGEYNSGNREGLEPFVKRWVLENKEEFSQDGIELSAESILKTLRQHKNDWKRRLQADTKRTLRR